MTRGSTIIWGKDELTRAPAPDAEHIRRDFNSAWCALPAPHPRSHSLGPRNESASASAQPGSNTPPGLCCKLRSQGLAAEKMTLQSFLTARAKLKLAKFAQAMLDVFAASFWLLYVALWIVVILGVLPFTVFCLFLIQF